MTESNHYSDEELYDIIHNTRMISSNPYKLFVAFVLSSLTDLLDEGQESVFDLLTDRLVIFHVIQDCLDDFNAAMENGCMIDIFGKLYSIRNKSRVDTSLLARSFSLPITSLVKFSPKYIIKQGQYAIGFGPEKPSDNMLYFQKIVMLADSTDDGYDMLTDIEAAVYCWGLFHSRHSSEQTGACMYHNFYEKYKGNFDVDFYELMKCVKDGQRFPFDYWSFSVAKIKEWNKTHGQKSVVDEVNDDEAVNFWYDVAIKKRFLEK